MRMDEKEYVERETLLVDPDLLRSAGCGVDEPGSDGVGGLAVPCFQDSTDDDRLWLDTWLLASPHGGSR